TAPTGRPAATTPDPSADATTATRPTAATKQHKPDPANTCGPHPTAKHSWSTTPDHDRSTPKQPKPLSTDPAGTTKHPSPRSIRRHPTTHHPTHTTRSPTRPDGVADAWPRQRSGHSMRLPSASQCS